MKGRLPYFALFGALVLHGAVALLFWERIAPRIDFRGAQDPVEVVGVMKTVEGKGEKKALTGTEPKLPSEASVTETESGPVTPSDVSPQSGGGGAEGSITDGSDIGIRPPGYPSLSRLRGEEGDVLLSLLLGPGNTLEKIEVLGTSGYAALDRAAVAAIQSQLPKASGTLAPSEKKIRFRFQLVK